VIGIRVSLLTARRWRSTPTKAGLAASPDGRTLYYGAQQLTANIWKVERPKPAKK
jgi:hypothetical protein